MVEKSSGKLEFWPSLSLGLVSVKMGPVDTFVVIRFILVTHQVFHVNPTPAISSTFCPSVTFRRSVSRRHASFRRKFSFVWLFIGKIAIAVICCHSFAQILLCSRWLPGQEIGCVGTLGIPQYPMQDSHNSFGVSLLPGHPVLIRFTYWRDYHMAKRINSALSREILDQLAATCVHRIWQTAASEGSCCWTQ